MNELHTGRDHNLEICDIRQTTTNRAVYLFCANAEVDSSGKDKLMNSISTFVQSLQGMVVKTLSIC